jgi:putative ABC transport system permease protein
MDRLAMDLRLAARSLIKRPMMTATVVMTLACGIGANAAVFGIIDALVIRPFTMRDVDRIVMPVQTVPNEVGKRESVSPANFLDWRRDLEGKSIQDLAAFEWWEANLMGRDEPEHAIGFRVSSRFFDAMGVRPALGRPFLQDEEVLGRDRKVILSDGLWRRRFGQDRSIVGQAVLVDGAQSEVVGVMPAGFDFPMGAEIWAPLAFDPKTAPTRTGTSLTVVGRLAPGRTVADAQAEMAVIAARLQRDFPRENRDRGVTVYTVAAGMRDVGLDAILSLWQAAALFVLLIACANIANLLLARGAERAREMAVRLALGSSRGRIIRESMLESVLLAMTAVPLALAAAWTFLAVIRGFMPGRLIRFVAGWNEMAVDGRMAAVTMALGVIAALAFGALPALQMSRGQVADALKSDGRTGSGPGRQRLRRALVVAEIALAMPLLVAALLSVRSVTRYLADWQGYEPNGVLMFKLALPEARYAGTESRQRFAAASIDALRAVPGVSGATLANVLPAGDSNTSRRIEIAGHPIPEGTLAPAVDYRTVAAGYFEVMRTPLLSGRAFTTADRQDTSPVVVVSQSMAEKFWPEGNAIGSQLRIGREPWATVVGICGDVIHDWFDRRNAPTLYRPVTQGIGDRLMYAVRTTAAPLSVLPDVRRAIAQVDPTQPIFDILPMRQALSEKTIGLQFVAGVMGTFAILALVLAMLGLYAVMSYLVAQRVREIGVRMALGATRRDVTRLALGQAARLTALGLAIGVAAAIALGRLMEAGLLGVISSDIVTPFAIALLLGVTGLASSYLPARRAAAVDPMTALRSE